MFNRLYKAAKYISDGAKHGRARKYADAALGKGTLEELEKVCSIIRNGGSDRKKLLIKVVPDRLHTIMPGMIILRTIMKEFGSKRVEVSSAGVREGYLLKKIF